MNILVLNGSPRAEGNTSAMVKAFLEGVSDTGHTVTVIPVGQKRINGCLSCEYCHEKGNRTCIQQDDMTEVYSALNEAEMIVIASPIYHHNMTGQMQCTINRFYAPGIPKKLKKCAMFLSSGGDHMYDGALFEYRNTFLRYMKLEDFGVITAHGEENKSPEKMEKIREFGRRLK